MGCSAAGQQSARADVESCARDSANSEVDRIDRERKQLKRKPAENQEEATADLQRIRKALRDEWERIQAQETLNVADVDELLYCAVMFGISRYREGGGSREGWKNRGVGGVAWQAVVVNDGRIVH